MRSVGEALRAARCDGIDRLDAQLMIARVLGRTRSWLLAHDETFLDDDQQAVYQAMLARRADGEPLAYLLGEKEFCGLLLSVTPDVLVPRPDSETLVAWALELLAAKQGVSSVLDLGTGSGALALAIAGACPRARVAGTDVSHAALAVARSNGLRLGIDVQWLHGDWWSALDERRFDLVVANPPYVADGDAHLALLRHEPRIALCAGSDGLDALRTIASGAPAHLVDDGWLLLEHGADQGDAVRSLLHECGFREIALRHDLAGRWRCTGGQPPLLSRHVARVAHHPHEG